MKCKEIFQIVGNPIETLKRCITADKREIKDFPKLPSPTPFIRETLSAICFSHKDSKNIIIWGGGKNNLYVSTAQLYVISIQNRVIL